MGMGGLAMWKQILFLTLKWTFGRVLAVAPAMHWQVKVLERVFKRSRCKDGATGYSGRCCHRVSNTRAGTWLNGLWHQPFDGRHQHP